MHCCFKRPADRRLRRTEQRAELLPRQPALSTLVERKDAALHFGTQGIGWRGRQARRLARRGRADGHGAQVGEEGHWDSTTRARAARRARVANVGPSAVVARGGLRGYWAMLAPLVACATPPGTQAPLTEPTAERTVRLVSVHVGETDWVPTQAAMLVRYLELPFRLYTTVREGHVDRVSETWRRVTGDEPAFIADYGTAMKAARQWHGTARCVLSAAISCDHAGFLPSGNTRLPARSRP